MSWSTAFKLAGRGLLEALQALGLAVRSLWEAAWQGWKVAAVYVGTVALVALVWWLL